MNKFRGPTPFPMAQLQWKHLPAQIIYPECTVQLEVRSLDRSEIHKASRLSGRHSQIEKICYRPTILNGLPCYPSRVAMKSTHSTK